MPVVPAGGKILVTGASGFIGAWIVKTLVDQGYKVKIAVRNEAQAKFIENRLPEYAGKVSHVFVTDIEKDGAYDEAVKDVDGIIHTASPVVWQWEDPSEITGPARKGATNILKSAKLHGPNVKRVVLTSSSVAMVQDSNEGPEGTIYDETLWNNTSAQVLEEKGKETHPWVVYAASKVLAERAANEFIAQEKPQFDLTVIMPVWTWGPFLHDVSGSKGVGTTPAVFLSSFKGTEGDNSGKHLGNFVDVRDTALIHVLSLSTPAAGGERILTSNRTFSNQDMYNVLNAHNVAPGKVPPTKEVNTPTTPHLSGDKALRIFPGFKYRSLDESVGDMGRDFAKGGFL